MFKRYLYVVLYSFIFFAYSCKKDNLQDGENRSEGPKRAISFSVKSLMDNNSSSIGAARNFPVDSLKKYVSEIIYRCYDEDGLLVSEQVQDADDEEFGTVSDSLQDGNYSIAFFAAKVGTHKWRNGNEPEKKQESYFLTHYIGYRDPDSPTHPGEYSRPTDCFAYSADIVVSSNIEPTEITLARITGQVEIEILDDIPSSVSVIEFSSKSHYDYFPFDTSKGSIGANLDEFTINSNDETKKFITYIAPLPDDVFVTDITLTAKNSNHSTIAEKTISNVQIKANYRTLLKGNLFSSDDKEQSSFKVLVDTTSSGVYHEVNY